MRTNRKTNDFVLKPKFWRFQTSLGITTKHVVIMDNFDDYARRCKSAMGESPTAHPYIAGQTFGSFVYLRDRENLITLVHELIHVADNLIADVGLAPDTELRAYLVEGVMRKYVRKVLGWKTKKFVTKRGK